MNYEKRSSVGVALLLQTLTGAVVRFVITVGRAFGMGEVFTDSSSVSPLHIPKQNGELKHAIVTIS